MRKKANKVTREGRRSRVGAWGTQEAGRKRPDGRAKGGSHRVGRTGIAKPKINTKQKGKQSAPMFNAMRGSPDIMKTINRDSAGRSLGRPQSKSPTKRKDPPKVLDKMYRAMRATDGNY